MQTKENKTLFDDEKKYRKLRKVLRQIEHLEVLPRPLNEEEKQKVLKRNVYRQQLKELNIKYPNNELLFRDNQNTSCEFDNSQTTTVNDQHLNLSDEDVNVANQVEEIHNESFDTNLDELTSQMNSLIIEKSVEQELINEPVDDPIPSQNLEQKQAQEDKKQPEIKLKVTETKTKKKPIETKPIIKPVVCFDTNEIKNAHADLIVSLDLCTESELIVTGSRDTSIKVWSIKNIKDIKLIHSFGGHSGSITLVKFWPIDYYKKCLANLASINGEAEEEDEEETEEEASYPLIISSSLDCSIRIWNISKGACIKEFYLYNPVYHFHLNETSFLVGLGAGKIQYWNNLTQVATLKAFDDIDSVCYVQEFNETKKMYALSQTGILKVFQLTEDFSLVLVKESNIYSILAKSYSLKKNFKSFEIINEDKILLINDNQSFLILFDLSENNYQFISTNTNSYGFTSCFFRLDNLFFVSAYNIDDESSNINVFDYGSKSFQYVYSLYDSDSSYSLSTLSVTKQNGKHLLIGSSRETLKIWSADELLNDVFVKSGKKQVKYLKMCKRFNFHAESGNEDVESDDDDADDENSDENVKEKKQSQTSEENVSKRSCSIQ